MIYTLYLNLKGLGYGFLKNFVKKINTIINIIYIIIKKNIKTRNQQTIFKKNSKYRFTKTKHKDFKKKKPE